MSILPNPAQPSVPATPMDLLAPSRTTGSRPDSDRSADAGRSDFADRLDRERSSDRNENRSDRAERRDRPERAPDRAEDAGTHARPSDETSQSEGTAQADPEATQVDSSDAPRKEAGSQIEGQQADSQVHGDGEAGGEVVADVDAALLDLVEALKTSADHQPDGLTLVGLSGEAIQLAQPASPLAGTAGPGELGRWFMEAAGPVLQGAKSGPDAHKAGLLNTLSKGQSSGTMAAGGHGLSSGLPGGEGQPLQTSGAATGNAMQVSGDAMMAQTNTSPDFADILAQSNAQTETLDQFVSQAMAKTSAADLAAQPTQTLMTGQTMAASAQPMATAAPTTTTGQAVPVTALAVEITRQAMNGKTQFDIRLDPPELGRLNVRLEMDASGQTRTHLVVERAETLDMLTADARNLERALQQAGLKADPGSVSFELAQDNQDGLGQNGDQTNANDTASQDAGDGSSGTTDPAMDDESLPVSAEAMRYQVNVTGHLDVRV